MTLWDEIPFYRVLFMKMLITICILVVFISQKHSVSSKNAAAMHNKLF